MLAKVFDKPGREIKLSKISTKPPKKIHKSEARRRFAELGAELFDLQQLMWGAGTHSVLLVLQGRDTGGKDGTIKHVIGNLNPRGVRSESFGVPNEEELEHDFLWRIHRRSPRRGEVVIFNRSHYEDVLVVRVHQLVPERAWRERFELINGFERQLIHGGTIVLKFFLHISREEQLERLLERELEPHKAFKLNAQDWRERTLWGDYTDAYEEVIERCSFERAPWYVVPADKKWFRNLVVAEALCHALRPYRHRWEEVLLEMGERRRGELDEYRDTLEKRERVKIDRKRKELVEDEGLSADRIEDEGPVTADAAAGWQQRLREIRSLAAVVEPAARSNPKKSGVKRKDKSRATSKRKPKDSDKHKDKSKKRKRR